MRVRHVPLDEIAAALVAGFELVEYVRYGHVVFAVVCIRELHVREVHS